MDVLLIFSQLILGMLGVLGVATSQAETSLVIRQLIALGLGLAVSLTVSKLSSKSIIKLSPLAYVSTLSLLILVLFIGVSPNGSEGKRWIDLGFFSLQPSEFMKIALIAYLTAFFHNHIGNWELWRPMVLVGLAVGLILLEPNFSTGIFIFILALSMMISSGTSYSRVARVAMITGSAASVLALPLLVNYRYFIGRIQSFLVKDDIYGSNWQAHIASLTLENAGIFGIGPGSPIIVPEAHTDMISISIAQALGSTGIVTLIVLYVFIALRGISIANVSTGPASLLAAGATAYICGQAALNLLVASGTLPITGVVLPFVSHGLNSLVSVSIAMGFLHVAFKEAKAQGARFS